MLLFAKPYLTTALPAGPACHFCEACHNVEKRRACLTAVTILPLIDASLVDRLAASGWRKGGNNPHIVTNMTITEVLKANFYITTSGQFSVPGQKHLIDFMGPDRVMFSLDYPFEDGVAAAAFFEKATAGMRQADVDKVSYGNAARLMP